MEPLKGRSIEKILRPRYEILENGFPFVKYSNVKPAGVWMEMSGDVVRGRPARQAGLREH
jgi:hypothetical protein